MRFFCDLLSSSPARQLVQGLGSNLPVTSYQLKRRDAAEMELMLFRGTQGAATPAQIAPSFELRFALKKPDDFNGLPIVWSNDFAWVPADQVYLGRPSTNTIQLSSLFCQATGWRIAADNYTLVTGDKSRLVAVQSADAKTLTVPAGLLANDDVIYVVRAGAGAVTLAAAVGVTLTAADDLTTSLAIDQTIKLTRTGANAWTYSIATELAKVALAGEWTWRDMAKPNDWSTVDDFTVDVKNDYIRGNETAPVDAGESSAYVLRSELSTGFVQTVAQTLSDGQKLQARTNIGALSDGDVVSTTDQDLTTPQQTQARDNIGAAAAADLTALDGDVTALSGTVTALSAASVKSTAQTLTSGEKLQARTNIGAAADADVVKLITQSLTDSQKSIARANIGAQASASGISSQRLAATWNAVGNGTSVHLNGAANSITGTATARNVALFGAAQTVSSISGTTITMAAAHGGANGQACQVSGTTIASPLVAGTTYFLRDVTSTTLALAATPGGAAIALSGSISAMKVSLANGTGPQHRRLGYVSASTAGSSAGTRHGVLQWAVSSAAPLGLWTFTARWMNSDAAAVANARCFVGMAGTGSALANGNPSALTKIIGVGADTGDANLSIMHNDDSGAATKISLGSGFPANTRNVDAFELVLQCNADATITYTVTNLTTAAVVSGNLAAGTNLPDAYSLLAPVLWRNNGTTALAVGIDVIQWSLAQVK